MLERGSGIALWRQIQKTLEADILDGGLTPGQRLPTESELAARFGVNRHTVRRALAALEAKGLVRIEQGRGSFVQEDTVDYLLARRVRFSENLLRQRRTPGSEFLGSVVLEADKSVARALRLMPGAAVLRMDSVGKADERVIGLFWHFYPYDRFQGLDELFRSLGSITEALKRLGVSDYTRKSTRISARMPGGEEARLLQQARTRPVLVTESVNVDAEGRPIEYGLARWASDRVQLTTDPDRLNGHGAS